MREFEHLPHFVHLVRHRGRIPGVSWIDTDRHWTPFAVSHDAVDDDRQPLLSIPVVTQFRKRTLPSLVVTARHVVEKRRAIRQMPFGQLLLDPLLLGQKPVHGLE